MKNKKCKQISLQYGMILQYGKDKFVVKKYKPTDTDADKYLVNLECIDKSIKENLNLSGVWLVDVIKECIYNGHFKIVKNEK